MYFGKRKSQIHFRVEEWRLFLTGDAKCFSFYRALNPGTQIGMPGRFQGLNTGVALYNLAHMRTNAKFNEYIMNPRGLVLTILDNLVAKFHFKSHLGDQCFFTLLSLEHPELFHILDCGYNFQLDESMFRDPWISLFPAFHNCTSKPNVYHMNGGSETPRGARTWCILCKFINYVSNNKDSFSWNLWC